MARLGGKRLDSGVIQSHRGPLMEPHMKRRSPAMFRSSSAFLTAAALALLAACGPGADAPTEAETEAELVERARAIHERVITLDTHVDINASNFTAERNYTQDLPTQVTLPKMEDGGLDAAFFIVYVGQGPLTPEGYQSAHAAAVEKFDAIHRLAEEIAPDRMGLALTSDDVRRIAGEGRKVALIGIENAYLQAGLLQSRCQVHRGGGFTDTTLAGEDGDFVFDIL